MNQYQELYEMMVRNGWTPEEAAAEVRLRRASDLFEWAMSERFPDDD